MIRFREREQVVPNLAGGVMKFDRESLFAAFGMLGQGSVCKTKPVKVTFFFDDMNDPGSVQRPEAKMPNNDRDRCAGFDRRVQRLQFDPGHIEHFPVSDSVYCRLKVVRAFADPYSIVIDSVASRRTGPRGADLGVRKCRSLLRFQKTDGRFAFWFCE